MAQAQPGIGQAPLARNLTVFRRQQAGNGRVHVRELEFAPTRLRLGGNAAVGHHQAAVAVQQQLVGVHTAGAPFGDFFQRTRIAHTDQPLAVSQVGLGGVEVLAIMAGNDMAVKSAVSFNPVPLFLTVRVYAQQPVTGAAAGKQQAAIGQLCHAMCTGGNGVRMLNAQILIGRGRELQNPHIKLCAYGPGGCESGGVVGVGPTGQRHAGQDCHALQPLPARAVHGPSPRLRQKNQW